MDKDSGGEHYRTRKQTNINADQTRQPLLLLHYCRFTTNVVVVVISVFSYYTTALHLSSARNLFLLRFVLLVRLLRRAKLNRVESSFICVVVDGGVDVYIVFGTLLVVVRLRSIVRLYC